MWDQSQIENCDKHIKSTLISVSIQIYSGASLFHHVHYRPSLLLSIQQAVMTCQVDTIPVVYQ